jgi:diguanylate cyclase
VLELVETLAIGPQALQTIQLLKSYGVRFAVDDFGAMNSSVAVLDLVQPSYVKLDISVVKGVSTSARRRTVAKTYMDLIHALGATAIAEGIETEADRDALRELGFWFGQGFMLGMPQIIDSEVGVLSS